MCFCPYKLISKQSHQKSRAGLKLSLSPLQLSNTAWSPSLPQPVIVQWKQWITIPLLIVPFLIFYRNYRMTDWPFPYIGDHRRIRLAKYTACFLFPFSQPVKFFFKYSSWNLEESLLLNLSIVLLNNCHICLDMADNWLQIF